MTHGPVFRFELGQRVRVVTHADRPVGSVTARWSGAELRDPYGENIYAVSVFVTRQRESSLEPVAEPEESGADPAPSSPS